MHSVTLDLPSPWREFLAEVDSLLPGPIEIHCLGGFVVTLLYGLTRTTSDVDYVEISPYGAAEELQKIAGQGTVLHKKYGLYFQHVTIASLPEDYATRLIEPFPNKFRNLRLLTCEPHDLALSKLARCSPIDNADVEHLAKTVPLDPKVLEARYHAELRSNLTGNTSLHDQTMTMWIDSYFPA